MKPILQTPDSPTDANTVHIYTDGGCIPNPGFGAWAAVLVLGEHTKEISGTVPDTTNNRMELQAALEALRALKRPCSVMLFSDSQYLIETMRDKWSKTKNRDLWAELDAAAEPHTIGWVWVRGHNGNRWNERAHSLVARELGVAEL